MVRFAPLLIACALAPACVPESPAGEAPAKPTIQSGPWMMDPGAHQMTIAWTTRLPMQGRVDYAPASALGAGRLATARESAFGTDHRVTLTGLEASQRYQFTLVAEAPVRGSFVTAPDASADPFAHPFSVLVYGDNRSNGGDHALIVSAAVAQHADLALHTGDMVVDAKDQRAWTHWFDVERDLLANTPLVPTVGNHEITDQGVTYSRHFMDKGLPAYHALDYGNVHIQVLDSFEIGAGADPHAGAVSEAQKAWAEADAKAVPADHHLWMLVHQGPHTHPAVLRPGHGGLVGVQDLISQVWRVHPVEAVFAGHEHFYERGELEGLRYFVIGGGGAPLEDPEPRGEGVALAVKELSFVTLEVCGCHVTGKARDLLGHVFDSFILSDCPKACEVPIADAVEASTLDAGTKMAAAPNLATPIIAAGPAADAGAPR